jgi:NAD(P)-dependent dehydrogenase (short-subunit alcohol dehydrogenase family)
MQDPILILGATGTLGGGIARRLAASGPVIVHGRRPDERLEAIAAATSGLAAVADLTEPNAVGALFAGIERMAGLVFAVGAPFPNRLAHRTSWDDFSSQIDSQLKALHLTLGAALPKLRDRADGARVLVLSTEYVLGIPPAKIGAYVAAKAAMTTYARVVAQEWLPYGIRVHVLAPGMVKSNLTADLPQEYLDQVAERMPEGRLTSVVDVAGIAAFLMTAEADPLYGTIIPGTRAARR